MKYTFTALALAALALASPVPEAAAPAAFKITNIVSGGSGCPQGSIEVDWTDNRVLPICMRRPIPSPFKDYYIILTNSSDFGKEFTARVGSGISIEESRKFCQLNIALKFNPGYQFAIYSTDVSGWADLDAGVKGQISSNYYFSGETDQVRSIHCKLCSPAPGSPIPSLSMNGWI